MSKGLRSSAARRDKGEHPQRRQVRSRDRLVLPGPGPCLLRLRPHLREVGGTLIENCWSETNVADPRLPAEKQGCGFIKFEKEGQGFIE